MSWQRIKIILLHTWFHARHSVETWVDLVINPLVQLVVYVYIVIFLSGHSQSSQYVIAGAILWNVVWIGQYCIAIGALWEIWSRSFSSLFVSPLTLAEFVSAQIISSIIKSLFILGLSSLVAYIMFDFSIFSIGPWLTVHLIELLVFSWAIGMFVLGLIIRFGTRIQSLSWLLVFFVQPIGAVFYPLSVLPPTIKTISLFVPTTYIFETIRSNIAAQPIIFDYILMATMLNLIYIILGYLFLNWSFDKAKETGQFVRIEG